MHQTDNWRPTARLALRLAAAAALVVLEACGGGSMQSAPAAVPPSVTLSVQPATISLGQLVEITWSTSRASSCTASGAWTGSRTTSGTLLVTPGNVGVETYTLSCSSEAGGGGGADHQASMSAALTITAPSVYSRTSLVTDSGVDVVVDDSNLVNPWGLAAGPSTSLWISNTGSGTATVYDGDGVAQPHGEPLIVVAPTVAGSSAFAPTGIVHNPSTTDFIIGAGGVAGAAEFIVAGESGRIGGWSAAVDQAHFVTMYADADGAVYKGLALASRAGAAYLYATDFHNGTISVFDAGFVKQVASPNAFSFADASLPAGYAPFGIQAIDDGPGGASQLYVSYALQVLPNRRDAATGAGTGIVNVFDTSGNLVRRLVSLGGALDAPWGMALAPPDFGTPSHKLLVGNSGDGTINAFDTLTGRFAGAVASASGGAVVVPGLKGLAFGNDSHNQPHSTLFYTAGPHEGGVGEVGRIDRGDVAPVLHAPPLVEVTTPAGPVQGIVAFTAHATDALGIAKVQFFVNGTSLGLLTTFPLTIPWDTTTAPNGPAILNVKATDPDGNVAVSAAVTVMVAN